MPKLDLSGLGRGRIVLEDLVVDLVEGQIRKRITPDDVWGVTNGCFDIMQKHPELFRIDLPEFRQMFFSNPYISLDFPPHATIEEARRGTYFLILSKLIHELHGNDMPQEKADGYAHSITSLLLEEKSMEYMVSLHTQQHGRLKLAYSDKGTMFGMAQEGETPQLGHTNYIFVCTPTVWFAFNSFESLNVHFEGKERSLVDVAEELYSEQVNLLNSSLEGLAKIKRIKKEQRNIRIKEIIYKEIIYNLKKSVFYAPFYVPPIIGASIFHPERAYQVMLDALWPIANSLSPDIDRFANRFIKMPYFKPEYDIQSEKDIVDRGINFERRKHNFGVALLEAGRGYDFFPPQYGK